MKRFKYSLENVLHYKEQILDSIKAEHGTLLFHTQSLFPPHMIEQIRKKKQRYRNWRTSWYLPRIRWMI